MSGDTAEAGQTFPDILPGFYSQDPPAALYPRQVFPEVLPYKNDSKNRPNDSAGQSSGFFSDIPSSPVLPFLN